MIDATTRFDDAMFGIYRKALREVGYNATRFLQTLDEHRGLKTAKTLLATPRPSEGYTKLWECKLLDLTVEALVLKPEWNDLFTDDERAIARERLQTYGYTV